MSPCFGASGQFRRRDTAINTVIAYYTMVEGPIIRPTNRLRARVARSPIKDEPSVDIRLTAVLSLFIASEEERPRKCFLCIGLVLRLEADDPRIEGLTHEFYSSADVSKHFRRKHLSNLREGDEIRCGACDIQLHHKIASSSPRPPGPRHRILTSVFCPERTFVTCPAVFAQLLFNTVDLSTFYDMCYSEKRDGPLLF